MKSLNVQHADFGFEIFCKNVNNFVIAENILLSALECHSDSLSSSLILLDTAMLFFSAQLYSEMHTRASCKLFFVSGDDSCTSNVGILWNLH